MIYFYSESCAVFEAIKVLPGLWGNIVLILLSFALIYHRWVGSFLRSKLSSSQLDCFPGPAPTSFLFGNLLEIFEAEHGAMHEQWTKRFGPVFVYSCLLGSRRLAFTDPKAINYVLQRVDDYPRTKEDLDELKQWLGDGIASAQGDRHRRQHKLLAPFFSLTHLKEIAPVFEEKAQHLQKILNKMMKERRSIIQIDKEGVIVVDMYHWYSRTTMDIIGKAGFGHEFDSLENLETASGLVQVMNRVFLSGAFQFTGVTFLIRHLLRKFPAWQTWIRTERLKAMETALQTLHSECRKIFNQRKIEATSSSDVNGRDMLSLLIEANIRSSEDDKIPEEGAVAQIANFVVAGSETTATFLSWMSWMLALHPEVQKKLRKEILDARRESGNLSTIPLEVLIALPYLEAVCRETLRYIPPVTSMLRIARRADQIPLSCPIRLQDGHIIDHIPVEPGQTILIPVSAYQRSEKLFGSSPETFDPDRWLSRIETDSLKLSKGHGKPQSTIGPWAGLLAFSTGPKRCMGFQFALIESKVILAAMLSEFELSERDAGGGPEFERRANSVVRPRVKGRKNGAEMPLRLSKFNDAAANGPQPTQLS